MFKRVFYKFLFLFIFFFCKTYSLDFKEVESGVFLHVGKHEEIDHHNKGDICNITFIIGEKSVLVVDSGASNKIADSVQSEIKKKTDLPIQYLVLTHGHPDHFFGTESFARKNKDLTIFGHEKLSRSLLINFDFYKDQMQNNTKDSEIKNISLVLPNKVVKIDETINIDIGNRIITLEAWRSGHTDNDLSVFDKKTKTLITENIFVDRIPPITASVLGWKKTLEEILKRDINLVIPGHGDPQNKIRAVKPMLRYFNRIIEEVREIHNKNLDLEFALNNTSMENSENWLLFNEYHLRNITRAFSELEWE